MKSKFKMKLKTKLKMKLKTKSKTKLNRKQNWSWKCNWKWNWIWDDIEIEIENEIQYEIQNEIENVLKYSKMHLTAMGHHTLQKFGYAFLSCHFPSNTKYSVLILLDQGSPQARRQDLAARGAKNQKGGTF